jgi:hypothetical protein
MHDLEEGMSAYGHKDYCSWAKGEAKKVSHGATFLNFDSIFGGGGVWILWSLTITS